MMTLGLVSTLLKAFRGSRRSKGVYGNTEYLLLVG